MFQFESFSALLSMDGHGVYVWASYAITLVAMTYLVISPLRRRRQLIVQMKRQEQLRSRTGKHSGQVEG